MNVRPYIRGTLWAGGLLLVVLVVSGMLWLSLKTLGDHAGSQGAKGVALVALVCFVLDLLALVLLLALAEITRPDASPEDRPEPPMQRP